MLTLSEANCKGCKICLYVCPHEVFTWAGRVVKLARGENCIECGACQLNCDYNAIFVTKGTGCLAAIVKEDILQVSDKGCG